MQSCTVVKANDVVSHISHGFMVMKGQMRFDGKPTSAEVVRKGDDWYLSVTFAVEDAMIARPRAEAGAGPFAFDTGLTDLMTTLQYKGGEAVYSSVDNPRWLKSRLVQIVEL